MSNRALLWALTSDASPLACCQVDVPFTDLTVGTGDGVAAGVPDADGVGVADADEAGVADGVGVGLAFACAAASSRLALLVSSAVRLAPALPRSTSALVEAVGDALAFAVDDEDGLGEGVPDAVPEGVGDAVGVGGTAVEAFGAISCTWRNSSSAVWLTSWTIFCEFWPGTDTVMMLVPCGTTCASVKPALFTRLNMICCASVISVDVTFEPCTGTAFSETVVPLVRSRPRCTWNAWCHLAGVAMSAPTMARSNTTMIAASTAR